MKNLTKMVFFATAWSTESGGINSFNIDLCSALTYAGAEIYVVVSHCNEEQVEQARSINITLVETSCEYKDFHKKAEYVKQQIKFEENNVSWIGHDSITGGAAIYCKNKYGGQSVILHHMDYSNYYYLKALDVKTKINQQKVVLKEADIVIAVGPRLYDSARHLRDNFKETYEIHPGFTQYQSKQSQFDFRITVCGRLGADEDNVKNISAAVGGAIGALSINELNRGCVNLIGAIPGESFKAAKKQKNAVAINSFPFVSTRDEYFSHLIDSDILLMPSVKEGFGLVAWEAACLGIPVLVSKASGFYEFVKRLNLQEKLVSIDITGIIAVDEKEITKILTSCFDSPEQLKKNAQDLSKELQKYSWDDTAQRFVDIIEHSPDLKQIISVDDSPPEQVEVTPEVRVKQNTTSPTPKTKSKGLSIDRDIQYANFERFEDLLSITYKKRELIIPRSESTDFSKGKKIKFEFWKVFTPQPTYFLYINPGSNISQTIKFLAELLVTLKIRLEELYVLRRDNGDGVYMSKVFQDNNLKIKLYEFSLKEYIWEYCIDAAFKRRIQTDELVNYIDQSLEVEVDGQISTEQSRSFLLAKLSGKSECSAYLIVATGGMGKTWLCRSLVNQISHAQSDKLVVLIQAETLRDYFFEVGFAHIQVKSVFDLYSVYENSIRAQHSYDRSTFELAVISGNIVVIVDGLDELATVLQERFDIISFLNSVNELSSSLQSSQILLTTRDNLLVSNHHIEEFRLKKYNLLGFSQDDWTRFATKRFSNHSAKSELVARLNRILSDSELVGPHGRVIPFLVDVVSNILEEQENDKTQVDFELTVESTPYSSNNDVIDRVVYSIFRREIRRQNIDIPVEQLVSHLCEIISEHGEQFGSSILRDLLDLFYDSRANELFKKIALNPLFIHNGETLKLRYGFLQSHFRALLIIYSLQNNSVTHEALSALAKSNANESPEVAYVKKYFLTRLDKFDEICSGYFYEMRKLSQKSNDGKEVELARRAISGLLKIYSATRSFSGVKLTAKILDFLSSSANDHRSIDGLCIYGEFPYLDFSDITVLNAKFLDYKNFSRCKFKGAKFLYCTFESCADDSYIADSIGSAVFDDSCSLGDISKVIDTARSKDSLALKSIEADALIFLRSFFNAGSKYDPKTDWIKFSTRTPGLKSNFFSKLIPEYFVVKSKKSDNVYYSMSESFVSSARNFIDNNYKDDKFRKFLSFIS